MGTRPVSSRAKSAQDILMGDRETQELEKSLAEFLRKLEAGKKDIARAEKRAKPAR